MSRQVCILNEDRHKTKRRKGGRNKREGKADTSVSVPMVTGLSISHAPQLAAEGQKELEVAPAAAATAGAGEGNEGGNGDKMRSTSQALGLGLTHTMKKTFKPWKGLQTHDS